MNQLTKSLANKAYASIALLEYRKIFGNAARKTAPAAESNNFVILAADPITLTGSKGDEAMLVALRQQIERIDPENAPRVLVSTSNAAREASRIGYVPILGWPRGWGLNKTIERLETLNPKAIVALGADMMDAHYSIAHTTRILGCLEWQARRGLQASTTGFSFNENPSPSIKSLYKEADKSIKFNIRDDVSKRRFEIFTGKSSTLTADIAFLLEPKESHRFIHIKEWSNRQRALGKRIIGVNAHPMLTDDKTVLISSMAAAITNSLPSTKNSLVFLSHDTRGDVGDEKILLPLIAAIRRLDPNYEIAHSDANIDASEIKLIASIPDIIITGRMHLAIAALGMKVPVIGLGYQGKFRGLLDHFKMPDYCLIPSTEFTSAAPLEKKIRICIESLKHLSELVSENLPDVRCKALLNMNI